VTAVAGAAGEPGTYYMGATGGGVWKTKDYGISWDNVSDGYFASPSIGAIRLAPSNPDIIYVGTGSDGIRSNVISGKGVYKSLDAGQTWTHVGLRATGHIGAVEIHPDNPNVVYVAAIGQAFNPNEERGVFRTVDGGRSWEKVLYISDSIGIVDIEIMPGRPDVIYASAWRVERKPWTIISGGTEGGIYRSEDGGDTWDKIENGLPGGLIGKIDLAVTPAAPRRLYALIEAPVGDGGLYVSNDMGDSFQLVSTKKELLDRPFYYCNVDADPNNADVLYVNSTRFYKSEDGGHTWTRIMTPHGDNHDMWIDPDNPDLFIQGNDGGANITTNGGKSWSSQFNQPTAELYQVEVDDDFPYNLYAGQQDNSTIMVPSYPPFEPQSGGSNFWRAVGVCETGPAVPEPGDPNIVYANCKGGFGVYDKRTDQEKQYYVGATNIYSHNPRDLIYRFQRVSPIHVSPHDPGVVYHASQYVHMTTNEGQHWSIISPDLTAFTPETQVISGSPITRDITGEEYYSTIYSLRESPLEKGFIWVGANDGPIHVTKDGGKSWKKVTPESLPPGGRVDCIEPSPHDPAKAYISVLRYQFGDWRPYILRTNDYGESWVLLTKGDNGIPADFPTRVVREDPVHPGLLFAGTEYGVFISYDDGESWLSFQQNLPVTPVTDLKIHQNDLVLSTMGRGFWIMDDISSVYDLPEKVDQVCLFPPLNVTRSRFDRGDIGQNEIPTYPSAHVNIDYLLPEEVAGQISLEIRDDKGRLVRKFVNSLPAIDESMEEDMATGFRTPGVTPALKTTSGLHRFKWDLRYEGKWDKDVSNSGRSGPMAAPGKYAVSLLVGERSFSQELEILEDPRISATGISSAVIADQVDVSLEILKTYNEAKKLLADVEEALEKINVNDEASLSNKEKRQVTILRSLLDALKTSEGRYMTNMLVDQLNYLYNMLNRADQVPGKDALDRHLELSKLLADLKKKFNDLEL
jgi:photosystem II stability/assembly factor-like uncharacterized protein